MMNVLLAVLCRSPVTCVVAPGTTPVSTGKFCSPLGPVSASFASLGVTPSPSQINPQPAIGVNRIPVD